MDIHQIFSAEQITRLDIVLASLPVDDTSNIAYQLIDAYFSRYMIILSAYEAVIYLIWKCPDEWKYGF